MSGSAIARELLVAHAALIALVPADRIHIGVIPQGDTLPVIGITEVSATDHRTVAGKRTGSTKVTEMVQVTVVGANLVQCKAVLKQVRRAGRDFTGTAGAFQAVTCRLDGKGPDFFPTDIGTAQQSQDLRITYDESNV